VNKQSNYRSERRGISLNFGGKVRPQPNLGGEVSIEQEEKV
jgi:hypothetical protein